MNIANFIAYNLLIFIALIEISVFIYAFEYFVCIYIRRQIPFVPSNRRSHKLLAAEINKRYPNAKLICEIGSGYGTMARFLGRNTKANVIALENMPISVLISKTADLFQNKSKTIKCDAFEYLDKTKQKIDIGVAYLSPIDSTKLLKYKGKIKTLITLDFAIVDKLEPTKTIHIGHGYTLYNHKKYPHKIFIYDFE